VSRASGLGRFLAGFAFALDGVINSLITERNLRFHFAAAGAALLISLWLRLDAFRLLWVLGACASVIAAELFNTALERVVDLARPGRHPLAKGAKDAAAAAVLAISVLALAVGAIVLGKPLMDIAFGAGARPDPDGAAAAAAAGSFALLGWCALRAWCVHRGLGWKPAGWAWTAAVLALLWMPQAGTAPLALTLAVSAVSLFFLIAPPAFGKAAPRDQAAGFATGAALAGIALLAGML